MSIWWLCTEWAQVWELKQKLKVFFLNWRSLKILAFPEQRIFEELLTHRSHWINFNLLGMPLYPKLILKVYYVLYHTGRCYSRSKFGVTINLQIQIIVLKALNLFIIIYVSKLVKFCLQRSEEVGPVMGVNFGFDSVPVVFDTYNRCFKVSLYMHNINKLF